MYAIRSYYAPRCEQPQVGNLLDELSGPNLHLLVRLLLTQHHSNVAGRLADATSAATPFRHETAQNWPLIDEDRLDEKTVDIIDPLLLGISHRRAHQLGDNLRSYNFV